MPFLKTLTDLFRRDRTARSRAEEDAPADPANAGSRTDEYVGRAGSDETMDTGLSGGEARAGGEEDGRTGAARDE